MIPLILKRRVRRHGNGTTTGMRPSLSGYSTSGLFPPSMTATRPGCSPLGNARAGSVTFLRYRGNGYPGTVLAGPSLKGYQGIGAGDGENTMDESGVNVTGGAAAGCWAVCRDVPDPYPSRDRNHMAAGELPACRKYPSLPAGQSYGSCDLYRHRGCPHRHYCPRRAYPGGFPLGGRQYVPDRVLAPAPHRGCRESDCPCRVCRICLSGHVRALGH